MSQPLKPKDVPIKNYIIPRVADITKASPQVVEAVVNHQFKEIVKAFSLLNVTSVEMSGFGKWKFLPAKAERFLAILEKELADRASGEPGSYTKIPTESIQKNVEYLKNQIKHARQNSANSRRVEKRLNKNADGGAHSRSPSEDLRDMPEQFQEQQ